MKSRTLVKFVKFDNKNINIQKSKNITPSVLKTRRWWFFCFFNESAPLGRFSHKVAMSVYLCVCLSVCLRHQMQFFPLQKKFWTLSKKSWIAKKEEEKDWIAPLSFLLSSHQTFHGEKRNLKKKKFFFRKSNCTYNFWTKSHPAPFFVASLFFQLTHWKAYGPSISEHLNF